MSNYLDESATVTGGLPVSAANIREFIRFEETAEDTLIETMIAAARDAVERYTGITTISRDYTYYLDAFPDSNEIELPRGKVTIVTSLKYLNTSGTLTTLNSDQYYADLIRPKGRIKLKESYSWPDLLTDGINRVQIAFTAGSANAAAVDGTLKLAIKSLVAYWHETRTPPDKDAIPEHVQMLLFRFAL